MDILKWRKMFGPLVTFKAVKYFKHDSLCKKKNLDPVTCRWSSSIISANCHWSRSQPAPMITDDHWCTKIFSRNIKNGQCWQMIINCTVQRWSALIISAGQGCVSVLFSADYQRWLSALTILSSLPKNLPFYFISARTMSDVSRKSLNYQLQSDQMTFPHARAKSP